MICARPDIGMVATSAASVLFTYVQSTKTTMRLLGPTTSQAPVPRTQVMLGGLARSPIADTSRLLSMCPEFSVPKEQAPAPFLAHRTHPESPIARHQMLCRVPDRTDSGFVLPICKANPNPSSNPRMIFVCPMALLRLRLVKASETNTRGDTDGSHVFSDDANNPKKGAAPVKERPLRYSQCAVWGRRLSVTVMASSESFGSAGGPQRLG